MEVMFSTNLRIYQPQLNKSLAPVNGYSRVAASPTLSPVNFHMLSGFEGDGRCSTDERLERQASDSIFVGDQIRESTDPVLAIPGWGDFECTPAIGAKDCFSVICLTDYSLENETLITFSILSQINWNYKQNNGGSVRLSYQNLDKEASPTVT